MPTRRVELSLDTEAAADRLWDILADVKSWPEWHGTSYVAPPAGQLQKGSTFAAELGGHRWNCTITQADRPNRLTWAARQPGIGMVHEWEFIETGAKTRVLSRESMSGWMLLFAGAMLQKKVAEHDEKWLAALKSRAEGTSG